MLSKEEIIDLALNVIDNDENFVDFPMEGEVFVKLSIPIVNSEKMAVFSGYFICRGYAINYDHKPHGKWIDVFFTNISIFPPTEQNMRLQPHHIALGKFQNVDRTVEYRMVRVDLLGKPKEKKKKKKKIKKVVADNILQFPVKEKDNE